MKPQRFLRLPVASDGWRFVLPLAALAVLVLLLKWYLAAGILFAATVFVLYFFRDPERKPPRIDGAIVSAADGRVATVEQVEHDGFPGGQAWRISVVLSLFDVHINRSPIAGRVESVEYRPGRFHNAFFEIAARENERNRIRVQNGAVAVVIDQIAGVLARRIFCSCRAGDTVAQAQRIGLIRFGSRTDVFLPVEANVRVKKGMKVHGGETVLAILKA